MKNAKPAAKTPPSGILFIVLLVVILAALFCKSLLPDYVHFSNDGPLGQENAKWLQPPDCFIGGWSDLNNIGSNAGSCPLGLTWLTRWVLGPVAFAKFYPPIALFILGPGGWDFFLKLRFSPMAAALGAWPPL